MLIRRRFLAGSAAGFALGTASHLRAQPASKAVKIVVPFPAGGGTDVAARLLADKLRGRYAPTIIVDNRVGGGGQVGVASLKSGDADGSLMLFTPDFPLTLYPHLYKKLPYAPADVTPVTLCGAASMVIAAGPGLPASVKTLPEFIQWCKANPKQASYASAPAGSTAHFAGAMLARAAGIELQHVGYRGGALAVQDVVGGQAPVCLVPVGEILPFLSMGRLRVLASTGPARSRFTPEVPTLAELGYKDVVVQSWVGMFVPAGTPEATIERLHGELTQALKTEELQKALTTFGFESIPSISPAAFRALVASDLDRWGRVVKATGFTMEE